LRKEAGGKRKQLHAAAVREEMPGRHRLRRRGLLALQRPAMFAKGLRRRAQILAAHNAGFGS
jgi:hypothetical protein